MLSANLVNRCVAITAKMEESVWANRYEQTIEQLQQSVVKMEQAYDSLGQVDHPNQHSNQQLVVPTRSTNSAAALALRASKMQNLLEQINSYQKSINEYQLAKQNLAASLFVLEPAVPAVKSEKPIWAEVLITVALVATVFGCMVALIFNRVPSL